MAMLNRCIRKYDFFSTFFFVGEVTQLARMLSTITKCSVRNLSFSSADLQGFTCYAFKKPHFKIASM